MEWQNETTVGKRAPCNLNRGSIWQKLDMCLWNTYAPGGNKVKIWQNLS